MSFFQLYAIPAQANLARLVDEFLQSNMEINRSKTTFKLADLDYQNIYRKRPWNLSLSSNHKNNDLDSSSRFADRKAKTLNNTLSLNKDLFWGGNFSLDNTLTSIDNDPSSAAVFFGGVPKINQFGQSITYKQALGANFLGRDQYQELKMAKSNLSYNELNMKNSKEQGVLQFYYFYLSACLNKSLLELQKRALERAEKRSHLIKKRVRDGLRQKVDLLQVEMNEMKQQEEFKNATIDLNSSMKNLANLLHRTVKLSELNENFIEKSSPAPLEKSNMKALKSKENFFEDNLQISLLKEKISLQNATLERAKYHLLPKLELFTQYSTNRYANELSQAFSQGLLGGKRKEVIVGLALNFPLWFKPQQIKVNQAQIDLDFTGLELEKTVENIKIQDQSLMEKISQLKKNITSAKKRKTLAKKVLREYNNLYRLGRRDLDQVISAEESLINTERSFIRYLVDKEKLLAQWASLRGELLNLLITDKQ